MSEGTCTADKNTDMPSQPQVKRFNMSALQGRSVACKPFLSGVTFKETRFQTVTRCPISQPKGRWSNRPKKSNTVRRWACRAQAEVHGWKNHIGGDGGDGIRTHRAQSPFIAKGGNLL
eukprot:1357851-Amorphochlora_amoeboformis.AAC.1